VRSPYVVALLDVQPRYRFIALELCAGGNLRLAIRRGLMDASDLARVGQQLRAALRAVHAAHAVHRDVKPANILVRETRRGSPIVLADFGLAIRAGPRGSTRNAGTLRYLAPELRSADRNIAATSASDLFGAGAVLLELALAPAALPRDFDRIDVALDVTGHVPEDLPHGWTPRLRSLLSPDPEARTW
jgi:serine/threonine protein kinase